MADGPQRADGMKLRHTVIVMLTGDDLIFWGRIECAAHLLSDES